MTAPKTLQKSNFTGLESSLDVTEISADLGFEIRRYFEISGTAGVIRAQHGHYKCHQILRCVEGEVRLEWINERNSGVVNLSTKDWLFWVPPGNWISIEFLDETVTLAVLASDPYDMKDYFVKPPDSN